MDINSIPDIFQSKLRIAIATCLLSGTKTFKELKALTSASDGNISVQVKKLKEAGYVNVEKDYFNNKPRTRYSLTTFGKEEFESYVNTLESIIRANL